MHPKPYTLHPKPYNFPKLSTLNPTTFLNAQQGLIIDALKHCPKIVGLALAVNPLTLGADDGRAGALGSWLGQSLMASAPRLVAHSQKSSM